MIPDGPAMETRLHYLPIADAEEGMVLGAPVVLPEHGVSNFSLPAGHTLTDSNIHQMAVRHAEFICVQVPDERSPEEREAEWAVNEMRMEHIFRAADLDQPVMARLYQAVLNFRRS
ncbi:MAG: hypothetical protein ACM3X0_16695 [Bacteroidota bacterium]